MLCYYLPAGTVPLVLDLRDRQRDLMNFMMHKTINEKEVSGVMGICNGGCGCVTFNNFYSDGIKVILHASVLDVSFNLKISRNMNLEFPVSVH